MRIEQNNMGVSKLKFQPIKTNITNRANWKLSINGKILQRFDTTSTKLKAIATMAIVLPRSALPISLTDFNENTDGLSSVCLRRTTGKCPSYSICNDETMFGTNEVKIETFMLIPMRATD